MMWDNRIAQFSLSPFFHDPRYDCALAPRAALKVTPSGDSMVNHSRLAMAALTAAIWVSPATTEIR